MKKNEQKEINYVMGVKYQLEENPPIQNRRALGRDGRLDWFEKGRVRAEELIRDGVFSYLDHDQVVRAQSLAHETYEAAVRLASERSDENIYTPRTLRELKLEPCATCNFILYCKDRGTTCSAFRAYVGKAGCQDGLKFTVQVPDMPWEKSFRGE